MRRFSALTALAPAESLVPHLITADPEEGAEFLREALERGNEGIMAKAIGATYAAGRSRTELAEDQEGAYARFGDPGR